jgi:MTH538 TIR-like domain (DUF1863)
MALGAIAGHALAPGLGGLIGGALAAKGAEWLFAPDKSVRKVFVSFDFDNDQGLKHLLVGQAQNPDSPFDVTDSSLKEAAPERHWKEKARRAIRQSDLVLVLLGHQTYRAPGVLAEVKMAREEGKPVIQLIGRRGAPYQRVSGAGKVIAWTWPNLKALFA